MKTITFTGLEELAAALNDRAKLEPMKTVLKTNTLRLERRMKLKTRTVFVKGYSVGTLASSIHSGIKDYGLTGVVGPTVDYAEYVEFGTRKMAAEPYAEPSLKEQGEEFKADLKKFVE